MSKDFWPIYVEWKQEWNQLQFENLIFVTDENLLIENIEEKISESNDMNIAKDMLSNIGVKI
jgi:hypothetical protein